MTCVVVVSEYVHKHRAIFRLKIVNGLVVFQKSSSHDARASDNNRNRPGSRYLYALYTNRVNGVLTINKRIKILLYIIYYIRAYIGLYDRVRTRVGGSTAPCTRVVVPPSCSVVLPAGYETS
jgi:hypothetical protein